MKCSTVDVEIDGQLPGDSREAWCAPEMGQSLDDDDDDDDAGNSTLSYTSFSYVYSQNVIMMMFFGELYTLQS